MEHAQREYEINYKTVHGVVLILILMEHAQREEIKKNIAECNKCLNPYFNGTCSKRV